MNNALRTQASIVGAVIALAAMVVSGCSPSGHASNKSPGPGKGNETQNTVKPGSYRINRPLVNRSRNDVSITLDRIDVHADHKLIARVVYQNITKATVPYTCTGYSDPTSDTLALADGNVIHSEQTYCSSDPNKTWTVKAGGKFSSYATFTIPQDFPQPFTFNWYPDRNTLAFAVSGITLR